ncbi:transmembrane protein, putative [Medicago truncatula]|uniref:Transmembrane protein, putative n=2 Tax=Medicago truncatula TaxID=3880 RepID=A0A072UHS1_MEDTR|nr:transmembrane protein, putative [Medicago truncatula]
MEYFLVAFTSTCNLAYKTYAINGIHRTRKLVNNSTQSPPLQATDVQVNLSFAITLPIGAAILTVLGWAIYKIRNKKPTQQAEEAEFVTDNQLIHEVQDIVAVAVNAIAQLRDASMEAKN